MPEVDYLKHSPGSLQAAFALPCSSPLALNNIACIFAGLHLSASQTVTLMLALLKIKKPIKSLSVSFPL